MTNKKNGFWRFCFSLIPGAGEMYMGFMKLGVSTMAVFVGIIALASWLGLGPLVCLAIIVWFYSFFQVHHLASLPPEQFIQVEDDYLFHMDDFGEVNRESLRRFRQPMAVILILVGIMLCYQSLYSMVWRILPRFLREIMDYLGYNVPRLLFGLLIIYVGVRLIQGKRLEMDDEEYYGEDSAASSGGFRGEYRGQEYDTGSDYGKSAGERHWGDDGNSGNASERARHESAGGFRQENGAADEREMPAAENLRTVIYMPGPGEDTDGKEK